MIKIENLSKSFHTSFRSHSVFENLSLTINDGTFFGVSGKSGAGKSTLLSLLAGLQKADSGKILIDGTDILSFNDDTLSLFRNKNIGFISQEQSFLENLNVLDNVRLPCFICKKNISSQENENITNRARALLSSLEISHLEKSYPKELSGGENRRLLIARALINDPKYILADEPTDAVNKKLTEEIIEIFKSLTEQGKTVILVSHDEKVIGECKEVFYLNGEND